MFRPLFEMLQVINGAHPLCSDACLFHADMREALAALPDCYIDAVVTDPPYHLTSVVKRFGAENAAPAQFGSDGRFARASAGFMGKQWDGGDIAFQPETWRKVWRVLKPGGYLIAMGGTRTFARMSVAIEDAGFEIRDTLMWIYGTGFPKSHDVSKGIDKAAGAEREMVPPRSVIAHQRNIGNMRPYMLNPNHKTMSDIPATDAARQWEGWGTALKPAVEPIVLARKPLSEPTVAANVLRWGTGAINIDGCRIHAGDALGGEYVVERLKPGATLIKTGGNWRPKWEGIECRGNMKSGRWPANALHDGSEEVVESFPITNPSHVGSPRQSAKPGKGWGLTKTGAEYSDSGSAARFFYSAKASKADRNGSKHPTIKPIALMQWLVRLVTPSGGVVLDPFAGSGTTGQAAILEGCKALLIERETEYVDDILARFAGEDLIG